MKNITLKATRIIPGLIICCSILVFALTITAFRTGGYVIEGEMIAPNGTKVSLSYEYAGKRFADSALVKDNRILLKGSLPEALQCTLSNSVNQQLKIILLDNETINLRGKVAKFYYSEVSGAKEDVLFNTFNKERLAITGEYRAQLKATSTDFYDRNSRVYLDFNRKIDSLTLSFVKEYPNTAAASLAIISSHMNSTDVLRAEACYAHLSERAKRSYYAKRIKAFIDASKAIAVGKQAPDFVLRDINGKKFDLKDYRGKYLFIDFWASWCKPCREEHPLLRQLNTVYQGKNIVFVSISMDTNEKNWRQAVADDGLSWVQLNDPLALKGPLAEAYSVMALPSNLILDPKGKILATKLRGQPLSDFLQNLFKTNN